jgi:hypothetical protein
MSVFSWKMKTLSSATLSCGVSALKKLSRISSVNRSSSAELISQATRPLSSTASETGSTKRSVLSTAMRCW